MHNEMEMQKRMMNSNYQTPHEIKESVIKKSVQPVHASTDFNPYHLDSNISHHGQYAGEKVSSYSVRDPYIDMGVHNAILCEHTVVQCALVKNFKVFMA